MKYLWVPTVLAIGFMGYFIGVYRISFSTNICYSNVIGKITKLYNHSDKLIDLDKRNEIKEFIGGLPLRGYESDCTEIEKSLDFYMLTYNVPDPKQ